MDGLEPITLVVKAPNQKIADQTVECSLDWTVKHLKKHLSDIYPSRPLENQQRIIYSGHLLKDESVLKDILKQYEPNQTVHTVHLVCSSPNVEPPSFPKQSEGLRNRRPAAAAASSASSTAEPMRTTASASSSENSSHSTAEASADNAQFISPNTVTPPTGTVDPTLYNYYYNLFTNQSAYPASSAPQFSTLPQAPSMGYSSAPFVSPNFAPAQWPTHFPVYMMNNNYAAAAQQQQGAFGAVPTAAGMFGTVPEAAAASPQWLASIQQQQLIQQQMYTQYFNYFMQYFQAAGSANQPILLPPPSAAEAAAAPEPAAGQPAARPARAAEPQAMRMNAQGGPVIDDEDDEEMNRDWLDWVYTFIRFSMLLCILYFYSSFSRFMTALCLMVVFYVYQAGWVRLPRQERRNVPQQQQQQQQQQQPEAQQQNPNANGQEGEGEVEGTEEPARPPAPVEHRPSALSLAWNFFISFFLSLAPQAPPAVNAN